MPAVARILFRYDRKQIEAFISVAIDLLDTFDPDPDAEDDDPAEAAGDEADTSWPEWHTCGRHKLAGGISEPFDRTGEDSEEDDPAGQCDEDGLNTCLLAALGSGAGCKISDPGELEPDREPEDGY